MQPEGGSIGTTPRNEDWESVSKGWRRAALRSKTIRDCLGYLKPTPTLWTDPIFPSAKHFLFAQEREMRLPNVQMPVGLKVLANDR